MATGALAALILDSFEGDLEGGGEGGGEVAARDAKAEFIFAGERLMAATGVSSRALSPELVASCIWKREARPLTASSSDAAWPKLEKFKAAAVETGTEDAQSELKEAFAFISASAPTPEEPNTWKPHPTSTRSSDEGKVVLAGDLLTVAADFNGCVAAR